MLPISLSCIVVFIFSCRYFHLRFYSNRILNLKKTSLNKKFKRLWWPDPWIWNWILHGISGEIKHFSSIMFRFKICSSWFALLFQSEIRFLLIAFTKRALTYIVGNNWKLVLLNIHFEFIKIWNRNEQYLNRKKACWKF